MMYTDFEAEFVQRTIDIISNYKGNDDVTLLINCLTGLLILPKERSYEKIPDKNIQELSEQWGIKQEHVKKVACPCCGYKLRNVVRQMRNSVAHMKVKAIPDKNGQIYELEFSDSGFIARLPVTSLKSFVIKLATTVAISSEKITN